MAQRPGQVFHIHAILQREDFEGVTQIVEPDVFRSNDLQDLVMGVPEGIWIDHGVSLG